MSTAHVIAFAADLTAEADCAVDKLELTPGDWPVVLVIKSRRIDSFGAACLFRFIQRAKPHPVTVKVAQPGVLRVLQVLGIDRVVQVEPLLPVNLDSEQ